MENSGENCVKERILNHSEDKLRGVCKIKPEFIVDDHVRVLSKDCLTENDKKLVNDISLPESDEVSGEPAAKKTKLDDNPTLENNHDNENENEIEDESEPLPKKSKIDEKKDKLRGQNKARPPPFKAPREQNICPWVVDQAPGEPEKKCSAKNCTFMHDRIAYLKIKEPDVGPECFTFITTGRCSRGAACRFASKHITEEGLNIVDEKKVEEFKNKSSSTKNKIAAPLQDRLRKRKYNFSKTERIIKQNEVSRKRENQEKETARLEKKGENCNSEIEKTEVCKKAKLDMTIEKLEPEVEKMDEGEKSKDSRLGPVIDYDLIKLRLSEKKTIDWRDKLFLSPLTTVGNLPFRRICKEYGADITCGEMALAPKILKGAREEWALVKRYETEDIFGVQLCGNNAGVLTRCAQLLDEETEIDFVDLNLGCPIDLIYKQGGGSGMLNRTNVLQSVIRSVSDVLNIPLTIKTRMGVYQDKPVAHNLTPKFRDWGASMITVHGRSREQRYTKSADWEYIEKCAAAANPIPVFGNGDILCYDDYQKVRSNCPSVQGVTIGRGALIKPWIFTEIKEKRLIDVPSSERLDIIKKYAHYGLDHWGSDTRGVEITRKFMLEWISFLHRYIPVGILEQPPQRINERPPYYRGRDEIETMMASSNCADWIKISEMFLGKVPESFHFLPKHKANSWK